MGYQHLKAVIQQRFAVRDIAQGTPDDHFEVLRYMVHYLRCQRRLADAPLPQHAHYPATLFDHPPRDQVLFPRSPIEAR